ncbi:MAG: GNAT family N-acetyltransferase [Opitutaceae bacterium]|nr:GNAT family N-acetyltransferase [Opitutaceae bacterium]
MPTPLVIAPAVATDAAAIAALLRDAGLPHEDFAPHLAHFLVARTPGGAIAGAIGAEVCGREALLRSLVVTPAWRGQGLGSRLLAGLERAAAAWGVERWWLLTLTADSFFAARGFRAAPRAEAPPAIAATAEFAGLCPSVASCWTRERRSA